MAMYVSNLDDFILPSQACINPLVNQKEPVVLEADKTGKKTISIVTDYSASEFSPPMTDSRPFHQMKSVPSRSDSSRKIATVSLDDCLACR